MKYMARLFIVCMIIFSANSSKADQILTSQTLHSFLATMPDVKVLANKMDQAGKDRIMGDSMNEIQSGNFAPYISAVTILKGSYPSDYKKLGGVVTGQGFTSVEEWAAAGDDIMAAYMRYKMGDGGQMTMEAMQSNLSPEMMAALPPEARMAMERGRVMLKAAKEVPKENIDLVSKNVAKIEKTIDQMQE